MRAWLLVEVDGPWGRDAVVDSELGPHAPAVWRNAMKRRGIRVITIRRDVARRHDPEGLRLVHVVAPRPGEPALASRRVIGDLHQIVSATESLLTATPGTAPRGWSTDEDPYVLVCTNGRHDSCCATYGRPLVRSLREGPWGAHLWECSHIGGDRFAGNLLLLPESLYFGRVDVATAERLLAAHDAGRLDLARFRGRSTLRLGEQAAEHFVRQQLSLDRLDAVTAVTTDDDGRYRIAVATEGGPAEYVVTVARTAVPSPSPLTCKGREGLSYPAFELIELTRSR